MYYINIFRDKKGITHYSSEEFSVFQDKIENLKEIEQDVDKLLRKTDLEYVGTLSYDANISNHIKKQLFDKQLI